MRLPGLNASIPTPRRSSIVSDPRRIAGVFRGPGEKNPHSKENDGEHTARSGKNSGDSTGDDGGLRGTRDEKTKRSVSGGYIDFDGVTVSIFIFSRLARDVMRLSPLSSPRRSRRSRPLRRFRPRCAYTPNACLRSDGAYRIMSDFSREFDAADGWSRTQCGKRGKPDVRFVIETDREKKGVEFRVSFLKNSER